MREPLHERRAKYDTVKARHAAAADAGGDGGKRKRNTDEPEYQARLCTTKDAMFQPANRLHMSVSCCMHLSDAGSQ